MSTPVQDAILNPIASFTPVNLPDCYTKIAELAFYKAEKRGFKTGHDFDDWLETEREYKEMLAKDILH
ncbi:DUF2934 domain-containing protein [Candidatus Methylobacter oryzae]|uniref:DUF2934 domain-containing protein n=1 Tax=Candidatus Methylobacter oryzae TaxID=2497749 RepID=A0ABY3C996_9GAMM|nr:DUF2934 domain-containing protein [Candidatus Methylobacter oryzae]TRW93203.1 DUF2934 domain-containing protein [Candidatus Methylobacter oryzae]